MIPPAIHLGRFRVYLLLDGFFRLDGGALFGIVPRTLWSKLVQADARNRIRLAMRSLLIETGDQWILVDTGIGDKFDAKFKEIYGVEAAPSLEKQLAEVGLKPEDIQIVINSHLHFDHAGGNTKKDPNSGEWVPAFPNARYVIQKGELEFALHTNERTRGSYREADYLMLQQQRCFDLVDGDCTIAPGVKVIRTAGHVPYHQSVLVESDSKKAFFLGDFVSTRFNLSLPYISAFDIEPLVTLENKKKYLALATEEGWFVFFPHDPEVPFGKVQKVQGNYQLISPE